MTRAQQIALLLYKQMESTLSDKEAVELQRWKQENPDHHAFFEEVMNEEKFTAMLKAHHPENKEKLKKRIFGRLENTLEFKTVPLYRRSFFRVAIAACMAMLVIGSAYLLFFNKGDKHPSLAENSDVTPPSVNKAMITLPDGRMISIDSLTSYTQGKVTVTKTADGKIVYTGFGGEMVFNTLTNPRGNQVIDIALTDGSHVWLNAGSSVTYPVSFAGNERKVSMTGEAFFKVAHNAAAPFTVSKGSTHITVLGTEFNVNAYDDEPDMKVTLLKGSVKVNNTMIKPGQQAVVKEDVRVVSNLDLDQVMAWKNGMFNFSRVSLQEVMRQISRWYDVDIEYQGTIEPRKFGGEIQRDLNLTDVLEGLKETGIHFRIEGKTLIVLP